jgi:hypothetical protein
LGWSSWAGGRKSKNSLSIVYCKKNRQKIILFGVLLKSLIFSCLTLIRAPTIDALKYCIIPFQSRIQFNRTAGLKSTFGAGEGWSPIFVWDNAVRCFYFTRTRGEIIGWLCWVLLQKHQPPHRHR